VSLCVSELGRAVRVPSTACAALAVALAAALACSVAAAHGTSIPHDLRGVEPCVDDASIEVRFERDDAGGRVAAMVRDRLERALPAALDGAGVPWRRPPTCPDGRGYLSIGLLVADASWYAPRAVTYELRVHVGWRRSDGVGRVRADPPDAFDLTVTDLFDERAVGVPAFVYLPGYVEAALRDLTVSWWEDQDATSGAPWWLPPLGATLALLSAASGGWWAWRRVVGPATSRGPSH
jgi:hypothetical protein